MYSAYSSHRMICMVSLLIQAYCKISLDKVCVALHSYGMNSVALMLSGESGVALTLPCKDSVALKFDTQIWS